MDSSKKSMIKFNNEVLKPTTKVKKVNFQTNFKVIPMHWDRRKTAIDEMTL